jgi:hypothetical protein
MDGGSFNAQSPTGLDAAAVNKLFDDALTVFSAAHGPKAKERALFVRVLGEEQGAPAFSRFLNNVASCPQPVVTYCQEILSGTRAP